jgi:hypothetical protein
MCPLASFATSRAGFLQTIDAAVELFHTVSPKPLKRFLVLNLDVAMPNLGLI